LAALKRELGIAGMIAFLQQFDDGSGNWAEERHAWVDRTTLDHIRKATASRRSRDPGARGRGASRKGR
jgi:hypothetical protein